MNRLLIYIYALVALLVASCTSGRHQQMLAQLEELERQNVADSLMTNDSLALALTDYFDRHGTPNEQLRAHYILGRTYADMGEAPAAIEAYLDAATRADTTASDCDYHTLSRVYGQMSKVLYLQNLMDDYIECINHSIAYAKKDKDTSQVLNSKAHKVLAYLRFNDYDTAIMLFEDLYPDLVSYEGLSKAARYCLMPVKALLERNELDKSKQFLDLYRFKTGYFNSEGNVFKGGEAYYYYKGKYLLAVNQPDSALHYFYKELQDGTDKMNQNMASHGLALAYLLLHASDSAAKYALYSYDMMDSVYAGKATDEVERAKAMYDYSRHQRAANTEHERAEKEHAERLRLSVFLLTLVLFLGAVYYHLRHKHKKQVRQYMEKVEELDQAQQELKHLQYQSNVQVQFIKEKEEAIGHLLAECNLLQEFRAEYTNLIKEKEDTIKRKSDELAIMKSAQEELLKQISESQASVNTLKEEMENTGHTVAIRREFAESRWKHSPVYIRLIVKSRKTNGKLTSQEWQEVVKMVGDCMPLFHSWLNENKELFAGHEYQTCLLLRMNFSLKQCATLIGIQQSGISKNCKSVMEKIFHEEGSGKELKRHLSDIY